jgi:hypothetical protein
MTQMGGESLQKFAIVFEQLVDRAHFWLTEHCIQPTHSSKV